MTDYYLIIAFYIEKQVNHRQKYRSILIEIQ